MFTELPGVTLLLAGIALVPGLVRWWFGRTLRRLADDPALPERLLAAQRRSAAAIGSAFLLLAVLSTRALPWTLSLLVLSFIIAAYPLRRVLYGETWSLAAYVGFAVRFLFAVWGFWILLAITPFLSSAAGSFDWLAGLALAAILIAWNARYADVLRCVLRTRPVEDPALVARFNGMIQQSGIPVPRFERIDLHGGAVANAIALPSLRGSSVIFTETLLGRLETDETVAICAHELAHLEHFSPRYLRRINVVNFALIASGAAVVPLARLGGLSFSVLPHSLWALVLLFAMAWRVRDRQRHETASDVRAVALCGDSEALVRGLVRLYTIARVPRRLEAEYERQATHPSLARRIRNIRAAAGTTGASLENAVRFMAIDGRSAVTFENDKLHWSEGEAAVHTLSYAYLAELRLQVRGTNPASLIAVERQGRRWEMPLLADDVARAQAVLDIVDARLPEPGPPPAVWPRINRVVLASGAVIGMVLGQAALAFVALLALMQPASPLVAAAGIASLAAAGLLIRQGGFGSIVAQVALLLAAFGVVLLFVARSQREAEVPRRAVLAAALLGGCAVLSAIALTLDGFDPVRLHQSARSASAAPVLFLAFAGALSMWRLRRVQYAAIPVIVAAAATTMAASTTFLDRFGRDPFIVPSHSLAWSDVTGPVAAEFSVPFPAASMQLSAAGRHVAFVAANVGREDGEAATFHVGRAGGTLAPVVADDLLFVDEDHVLVIRSETDAVEVRELNVESPEVVVWRAQIPDIAGSQLSFTAATRRWRVMGWDRRRQIVRAEGVVGEPGIERTSWLFPDADSGWIAAMASSGPDAVVAEARYRGGFLQRHVLWRWAWLLQMDTETRFRLAGSGGSEIAFSRLSAQCFAGLLGGDALLCSAFDGTRTRFIAVDPASKRVSGLAWVDGRFAGMQSSQNGWLAGWRDGAATALNLEQRQAIQIPRDCRDPVFQIAASDHAVATLAFDGRGSIVKVYKRD